MQASYNRERQEKPIPTISLSSVLETSTLTLDDVATHAPGPRGLLPITPEMLLTAPSGNLFGLSQNAGMGWEPQKLLGSEVLILSTHGGLRGADGTPIALGFHTGHWELGALVAEAAITLKSLNAIPFAGACTDPCDGRTQGTTGMLDSLPYRNDAAIVLRRLMRSLPTRMGVIGIATCDKGLPAMMMALAAAGELPTILIPGGVTLLPESGEDAGKVQTIGARYAQKQITLETAAEMGCRACATPGGGCQFLGTAATAQVIAEALGLALPHTALAPSGAPIWLDAATPLRHRHPASASTAHRHPRRADPGVGRKCHGGPRRLRRLHQPAAASARHCLLRRPQAPRGRRLGRHQQNHPAPGRRACPTVPATSPPCRSSSPEDSPK